MGGGPAYEPLPRAWAQVGGRHRASRGQLASQRGRDRVLGLDIYAATQNDLLVRALADVPFYPHVRSWGFRRVFTERVRATQGASQRPLASVSLRFRPRLPSPTGCPLLHETKQWKWPSKAFAASGGRARRGRLAQLRSGGSSTPSPPRCASSGRRRRRRTRHVGRVARRRRSPQVAKDVVPLRRELL